MTYKPDYAIGPKSPGVWKEVRRLEDVNADLLAALEETDDLLRRLSEWDMLYVPPDYPDRPAVTGDGPYWQREIAKSRATIARAEGGGAK